MDQPKKFNLIDQDKDLKIYFFTVQKGRMQINIPEDARVIMAYNDDDAVKEILRLYPAGTPVSLKRRSTLEVKRLVDSLNLQAPQEIKPQIEAPPAKEKTAQDFVRGMSLLADQFVKPKKDKEIIKKIISKIKCNSKTKGKQPK